MATIQEQLTDEQQEQLADGQKSVEDARKYSLQPRAEGGGGSLTGWWFFRRESEWDVAPWWSEERDRDLREFAKREGNDILSGAVSSMVKKFKAMSWKLEGPEKPVSDMQQILAEAEFGQGWGSLISLVVEDYCTQDKGAFIELIGPGDPDKEMKGLPVGLAHLDAGQCQLTGDTEYPVIYRGAKDGKAHKIHDSRVIHLVDMKSPQQAMNGVGFCAVSRVLASSEILLMLSQYRREKLEDQPQAGLVLLRNLLPSQWEDVKAEYERNRRQMGQEFWANLMVLTSADPERPVGAELISFSQLPEMWDEQTVITTYINVVALAFGVDAREFWPISSGALGTAAESKVMHQKARGKGVGDITSSIERAINWKVLPKRVEFAFDFQDDEEDDLRSQIEDRKVGTIMKMWTPEAPVTTVQEIRNMLADHTDYFKEDFLETDITQETEVTDTERDKWGPIVVIDRKGEKRHKKGYKLGSVAERWGYKANPSQARVPAGSPQGGQFTSGGGGGLAGSIRPNMTVEEKTDRKKQPVEKAVAYGWEGARGGVASMGIYNYNQGMDDLVTISEGRELKAISTLSVTRWVNPYPDVQGNYREIGYLATKERGYGRAMMEAAMQVAKREGQGVFLKSVEKAVGFYEAIGMKRSTQERVFYFTPEDVANQVKQDIDALEPDDGVFCDGEGRLQGEKQGTAAHGDPLPNWEGEVEITPEQVAEALRDWDKKAPRGWQGILET